MGFFASIGKSIQGHFDRKKEDQIMMEKLQKEADIERSQIFQEEFKKNASEVARAEAKRDAAQKSGLQKLRATNRARNLSSDFNQPQPGTFFDKLSDFTKKNKARMQENLEKTKALREVAEQEKQKRLNQRVSEKQARTNNAPGFGTSTWKM